MDSLGSKNDYYRIASVANCGVLRKIFLHVCGIMRKSADTCAQGGRYGHSEAGSRKTTHNCAQLDLLQFGPGYRFRIATHKKDASQEELRRRQEAFFSRSAGHAYNDSANEPFEGGTPIFCNLQTLSLPLPIDNSHAVTVSVASPHLVGFDTRVWTLDGSKKLLVAGAAAPISI